MRRSKARSNTRATFSPTTEPIEPPMNSNAKQPMETGRPSMVPTPEMNASRRPLVLYVARSRSRYFLESEKPSGSWGVSSASSSWKLPLSSTSSNRRRIGSASCWLQLGQTFQFFSHAARATTSPQASHWYQMPSPFAPLVGWVGAAGVDSLVFTFFCFENQAMTFLAT